ncbi:MAG TPA: hydroxymethylglutaryl-CoA lyase [Ferrovibrio sp.]|uniref:hydroxymethylglutaryl-CoA lyase n=1 Tax=Ferrovibrio sp. TaxID=1917215 RepID=UPI002B4AB0D9|nr:hydroxymethylglutaryl-CoA lyase [Ferrovibrio sp.]HLT78314.1 hydroxymethylglutaryl-CoA lyase [Ferrovibrio sp.]
MALPGRITLWEAGPRDGLQNEPGVVPADVKIELIDRLVDCGITHVEVTSFVSPKWVPQMGDHNEVMAQLKRRPGVTYQVLTPNMKGYEAARAAGAEAIGIFAAASESFSRRNINCSVEESIERFRPVVEAAQRDGVKVRGFVSVAVGCPFEGEIAPQQTARVVKQMYDLGCHDIALGDTIGVGTPGKIRAAIEACARDVPLEVLGGHFHDTYGQALANTLAALECGVTRHDASVAGLGGCPYAPGATGNVATEDMVYMLDGLGIETGIDLKKLVQTAWWISDRLGRPPVSRVAKALKSKCL